MVYIWVYIYVFVNQASFGKGMLTGFPLFSGSLCNCHCTLFSFEKLTKYNVYQNDLTVSIYGHGKRLYRCEFNPYQGHMIRNTFYVS